jgi:MSHA biogenesis protein MshO
MKTNKLKSSQGFTIIEIVVTIVIAGIIGIGLVSYISDSADSLNDASRRSKMASAGRTAVDRIALELHNALPRSIRVLPDNIGALGSTGDQCIEFIPVRAATNYINPSFSGGGTDTFDVIGFEPSLEGISGVFAVIFPTNNTAILYDGDNFDDVIDLDDDYDEWPNFPTRRPIQEISDITDTDLNISVVTLVKPHRFRRRSPTERFFVVEQPVSFCVVGDKLYRYSDYGFFATQQQQEEEATVCDVTVTDPDRCLPDYAAISASPPRIKTLIADNLAHDDTALAFDIGTQSLARNSLVKILLKLDSEGDTLVLNHEVLTRSVP